MVESMYEIASKIPVICNTVSISKKIENEWYEK